jgi:hypothetical protein
MTAKISAQMIKALLHFQILLRCKTLRQEMI